MLHKVKAQKEMLLLPVEHSASGSPEECHGVIAMTMYCQLESLMLDAGVVITSVSNRSGLSLRVWVWVRTDPEPDWRSGSSIHPNCRIGYGAIDISLPV